MTLHVGRGLGKMELNEPERQKNETESLVVLGARKAIYLFPDLDSSLSRGELLIATIHGRVVTELRT